MLGQPGVLGPLGNTSASFDGASGELSMPGSQLGANATLEGWFRWRSGTTVLRDTTDMGGEGWLLAFATAGKLAYRLGGQGFNTGLPIETVRDGEWHHIAATKSGTAAALYVSTASSCIRPRPAPAHSSPIAPWHVMRNGTNAVFSGGEADELALYTRALARTRSARTRPGEEPGRRALPGEPPPRAAAGPAAGPARRPGRRGAEPGEPAPAPAPPTGVALVRRGTLIARGARHAQRPRRPQARPQLARARPTGRAAGRPRLPAAAPRVVSCPAPRVGGSSSTAAPATTA